MSLGLFGALAMADRSLQTQRMGMEVTGHNLANVNTPGYTRQRLRIETSSPLPTQIGPQGTGAEATGFDQLRDGLLDRQIQREISVRGSLEAQQAALEFAQAALGQQIDRSASGPDGATAASGGTGRNGLAEQLSEVFAAFQSVSTNPTSTAERQVLIIKAQNLATQFNQISQRLGEAKTSLNDSLTTDVTGANTLLGEVTQLNDQIVAAELGTTTRANDLRDQRQMKIEELAKLVKIDTTEAANGGIDIAVDGQTLVQGNQLVARLETYDAGAGQMKVRTSGGVNLNLSGGSMHGTMDARDGALGTLRSDLDRLAGLMISEVNAVHRTGFGLNGTTGQDFFTGTNAGNINVNAALVVDPAAIQASGTAGAVGDNRVMLAMAQLATRRHASLGNQTFTENYGQTVSALGQAISGAGIQLSNQDIVENMLTRQRDSVGGVSLDEEMTNLIKYQKAFEASAKLIVTIDEMLQTVLSLKR